MKTTLEIPPHTVQFFSDLATILESDWKTLFEEHLEFLQFESRRNTALDVMEYADTHEEAGHIADRAIAFLHQIGEKPFRKETLMLTYQAYIGEIDGEDFQLLDSASEILDGTVAPAMIPEEADDEGEEWKNL